MMLPISKSRDRPAFIGSIVITAIDRLYFQKLNFGNAITHKHSFSKSLPKFLLYLGYLKVVSVELVILQVCSCRSGTSSTRFRFGKRAILLIRWVRVTRYQPSSYVNRLNIAIGVSGCYRYRYRYFCCGWGNQTQNLKREE